MTSLSARFWAWRINRRARREMWGWVEQLRRMNQETRNHA